MTIHKHNMQALDFLKNYWTILVFLLSLFVGGISAYNMLNAHDAKINELEVRTTSLEKNDVSSELKYNLKALMESQGLKYIELK